MLIGSRCANERFVFGVPMKIGFSFIKIPIKIGVLLFWEMKDWILISERI